MLKSLSRVVGGFLLACLAAGLVTVLFVRTPVQLASVPSSAFPQTMAETGVLALLTATHFALFAATFALVATGVGEWLTIRSPLYYAVAGAAISLLGFFAQFSSEISGQPTVLNAYAIAAYIMPGLIAGLVYWAVSGRYGGRTPGEAFAIASAPRPRIIIEKGSKDETGGNRSNRPSDGPRRSWTLKKMLAERNGLGQPGSAPETRPSSSRGGAPAEPASKPDAKGSGPATSVPSTKPASARPAITPVPPDTDKSKDEVDDSGKKDT